jgi:hypothetical protein
LDAIMPQAMGSGKPLAGHANARFPLSGMTASAPSRDVQAKSFFPGTGLSSSQGSPGIGDGLHAEKRKRPAAEFAGASRFDAVGDVATETPL